MKICFLSHTARMGGAERVLFETVDALKQNGVACHVLLPGQGELAVRLDTLGVPYDFAPAAYWITWGKATLWEKVKACAKIGISLIPTLRKIKQSKCDIVYSNTLAICNGAIAAALLGLPHVWHLHEFPGYHNVTLYFPKRFTFRVVRALSAACIAVSDHLASICEPYLGGDRLKVVYPSMHLASDESAAPAATAIAERNGRFRCVIVGGLFEGKGQEDAVQAMAHLQQQGRDTELVIVGEGSTAYRSRLEQMIAVHKLQGKIEFAGAVRDAVPIMQKSDVVLVCSRYETFGRVSIEAMVAGKPVIGARCAATPELIQEGVNGWLYEAGDSRDLAEKIRLLYDDRPLAQRVGNNGQAWASRLFTRQRYGRELMNFLEPFTSQPH